jgi:outer membrane protein OmpA-like peptidoglycan-associated protein
MRNTVKSLAAITAAAMTLAACQTVDPYTDQPKTSNATQGAIIGGVAGAAIGALTNRRQAGTNALIGGAVGAAAGAAIGNSMDQQEAELRNQLRSAGVVVERRGDAIALNMQDDILFRLNSTYVEPRAREIIRSVALVLQKYRDTRVGVYGFTDTSGSEELNERLSHDRAYAVADELVRYGVDARRINARGLGETNLRVPTPDNVVEVRNRRVEILLQPLRG